MPRVITTALASVCAVLGLTAPAGAEYTLVWSDEFDGTSVDPDNWEFQIGDGSAYGLPPGWGNNELQYYTDSAENCFVADGLMYIVAREEPFAGHDYTSARLRTLNKQDFLYGRMEARLKLPTGQGLWPAFWMLPSDWIYGGWAASGELDIMESVNIPTTVYGTLWYGGEWPFPVQSGGSYADGTDFSEDFHVYTVEWEPDEIRWYVDGIHYFTLTSGDWYSDGAPYDDRAPYDQRFHFLINIAVGGDWPGPPDGSTVFPQELVADWVRVYQQGVQSPFHGAPLIIPGQIEAEDFDLGGEGFAYHDCDAGNQGGAYRLDVDVDIEACTEGGYDVGWMCADEWLEYSVGVLRPRRYRVEARVASQTTGGTLWIEFNGVDVTGMITVPVTGGWQNWTTVGATAELMAGLQEMRFVNSSSDDEYNINYFAIFDVADLDRDGDVDGADAVVMLSCLTGAEMPPLPDCADTDLDGDGDVDVHDIAEFQIGFSEP